MDYVNAFVAQEQPLSLGACVEGVWKGMGRKFGGNLGRSVWTRGRSPQTPLNVAWDQASHLGKKKKKSAWAEKNRRAKLAKKQSGRGTVDLSTSPGHRSARFPRLCSPI